MNKIISTDVLVAYSQCPRKAYLLLCKNQKGEPHEYTRILQQQKITNQHQYINELNQKQLDVQSYSEKGLKSKKEFLVDATLQADGLEADCGLLTQVDGSSALGRYSYEPTIFAGTHTVTKEQRLEVTFAGYVLAQLQKKQPTTGRIIRMKGKSTKVKLADSDKTLLPLLEPLQEWVNESSPEAPPVILNKHCPLCQFRTACRAKAEQEDNLSLLDRVTPKVIRQYEKKGIFTVKQLSYLYKPRKRKKRAKNPPPLNHKIELQALAIRTEKIYLQELPELTRQPVELFLDIEGVPDQRLYYLIGLLLCERDTNTFHYFWADSDQDEEQMWRQFLAKAKQFPGAPIYHYGSYELRTLDKLARRYETNVESLRRQLVNVNSFIFGKIYFPVYSNSLKEIGRYIGTNWSSPKPSGIESLVWKYYWDITHHNSYKTTLLTYNKEDCFAVKHLIDYMFKLLKTADSMLEVDYANNPKINLSENGKEISQQFTNVLKFANARYESKKIHFNKKEQPEKKQPRTGNKTGYQGQRKVRPKPYKIVELPIDRTCPQCGFEPLRPSSYKSKRLVIDVIPTRSGLRKTVTEYIGNQGYCCDCVRYFAPLFIQQIPTNSLYGHNLKAWVIFQRVSLRLPYEMITEAALTQFNEDIPSRSIGAIIRDFGIYYSQTDKILTTQLLQGNLLHIDETTISIRGEIQYIWVFTNGKNVLFRLKPSRESEFLHSFLADYKGILVSDFYAGYDSLTLVQQKCWVHLIRDMNNDLRKSFYDTEFENFVLEVKDLIVPIMEAIQKYGLKKRNLGKFRQNVAQFYRNVIYKNQYYSELTQKYQKRFARYENSLFTFLEHDNVPWHNNMAERALRHIAKQRVVSGFFHQEMTHHYLVLLSIHQTCRFQGKSFYKFLLTGDTDINQFFRSKQSRSV